MHYFNSVYQLGSFTLVQGGCFRLQQSMRGSGLSSENTFNFHGDRDYRILVLFTPITEHDASAPGIRSDFSSWSCCSTNGMWLEFQIRVRFERSTSHSRLYISYKACWHKIWPGGFGGVRGLTAPIGLRLRASGRWLVAPMLRRRSSSGTGTRIRDPVVILGFAEYVLFSVYKSSVFLLLYR